MRGRRAAMVAGCGVLAALAGAFLARDDIAAWLVGYRFHWAPEGCEPLSGKLSPGGDLLVTEGESANLPRGGIWALRSGAVRWIELPAGVERRLGPSVLSATGWIVGSLDSPGSGLAEPFWWRDGALQMLDPPGAGDTWFRDINDDGQAVGNFGSTPEGAQPMRAFHWALSGGFRELPSLTPTSFSIAISINESGWIAGVSRAPDLKDHPVLWQPPEHRPLDLGLPQGFAGGVAVDLDDRGTVLINLWLEPSGRISRAFLWTEARGLTALPFPEAYASATAVVMDRRGDVLLTAARGDQLRIERSFLVRDGVLRELPGPRGALEVEYHGLSDHGWLIGTARPGEGSSARRGFVAEPVR